MHKAYKIAMNVRYFLLLIGVVFGVVAGLMTYIISYNELTKHFADKRIPIRTSLKSAFVSLIFFIVLGTIIGLIIKV